MEIIDIGRNNDECIKCHGKLSVIDKKLGIPICAKCIAGLVGKIASDIDERSLLKYRDDVDNLTDFISSSSKLMRLDNLIVLQACFNIYMSRVSSMGKIDPTSAKKIFEDTKRYIDIEIGKLEGRTDNDQNNCYGSDMFKSKEGDGDLFGKMMSILSGIPKNYDQEKNKNDSVDGGSGDNDNKVDNGADHGSKTDDNKEDNNGSKENKDVSKRIKID